MPPKRRRSALREREDRGPQITSYDVIEKMTPEQCNQSFEDMLSILMGYSFMEIIDNMLVFFTLGIWKIFFNMRQSYAHASLSFVEEGYTYLDCYISNEQVYNTKVQDLTVN